MIKNGQKNAAIIQLFSIKSKQNNHPVYKEIFNRFQMDFNLFLI